MQYNFTIERQQWNTGFRVSYIGTALRKGAWMYNYNSPVPEIVRSPKNRGPLTIFPRSGTSPMERATNIMASP